MKKIIKWQADDGMIFPTENMCAEYEMEQYKHFITLDSLIEFIECGKKTHWYDMTANLSELSNCLYSVYNSAVAIEVLDDIPEEEISWISNSLNAGIMIPHKKGVYYYDFFKRAWVLYSGKERF